MNDSVQIRGEEGLAAVLIRRSRSTPGLLLFKQGEDLVAIDSVELIKALRELEVLERITTVGELAKRLEKEGAR
jgi:hypothetical protein